jgi:hypothetical protein
MEVWDRAESEWVAIGVVANPQFPWFDRVSAANDIETDGHPSSQVSTGTEYSIATNKRIVLNESRDGVSAPQDKEPLWRMRGGGMLC